MKPSSFQTTIENQFDYICKRAMEDERKNYMLYLSRIAKREVSFSDVGDYLVSQFATTDNYSTDFQIFIIKFYSSYSYPVIPPTKASAFSTLPQEHFLLDI